MQTTRLPLIKCATELITYTTTDYGGSVITTLLAPSPAPSSKSTGTGVRSTHKRCVSLSDMKRQRPSAAEAARARSQLRQLRHVHNISAKVWDAQVRRWSLAVALDAPHCNVSRPRVGRRAVSDDTSTTEHGGGREGPFTTQAAQARPQHQCQSLGRPGSAPEPCRVAHLTRRIATSLDLAWAVGAHRRVSPFQYPRSLNFTLNL